MHSLRESARYSLDLINSYIKTNLIYIIHMLYIMFPLHNVFRSWFWWFLELYYEWRFSLQWLSHWVNPIPVQWISLLFYFTKYLIYYLYTQGLKINLYFYNKYNSHHFNSAIKNLHCCKVYKLTNKKYTLLSIHNGYIIHIDLHFIMNKLLQLQSCLLLFYAAHMTATQPISFLL